MGGTVGAVGASVATVTTDERDHAHPSPGLAGVVMLSVVVIWGLGPPVTKLITAPPLVGVSVRFWVSVPIVWAVTYAMGGG